MPNQLEQELILRDELAAWENAVFRFTARVKAAKLAENEDMRKRATTDLEMAIKVADSFKQQLETLSKEEGKC